MARLYFYDTRTVSGTETQFFHESRTKHSLKEVGTNMELDAAFTKDVTIKKIVVYIPCQVVSSTSAADTGLLGDAKTLVDEGIIQVQVGDRPVMYLPLSLALGRSSVLADVEYTQTTATDASYGIASFQSVNGNYGLDVDISVPARETLKFYIKTNTSLTGVANVRVVLECETGTRI